jgi:hypothetical protein
MKSERPVNMTIHSFDADHPPNSLATTIRTKPHKGLPAGTVDRPAVA